MGDGPPGFGRSFTCSVLLGIPLGPLAVSGTGLSPCIAGLSRPFPYREAIPRRGPATPGSKLPGLGFCAFARRYLRNHCCFLFLRLLRCFSSPGSPRIPMCSVYDDCGLHSRVSPFRDLRIISRLHLPEAFRSLSRLSSAPSAKASALCPSLLDQSWPAWLPTAIGNKVPADPCGCLLPALA